MWSRGRKRAGGRWKSIFQLTFHFWSRLAARFLRSCGHPKPPKPLTYRTYTKRQQMWAWSHKTHTQNRQCSVHFLRLMLFRSMHTHTHTPAHWRQRVGGADQSKCGLKRTPRDTHLHINRGSPYQKQRVLSSQPTSSGTGRGERGLKRRGGGGSENMLHGRKGRAKSFITVITTRAHLLFHSAGEERRGEKEKRESRD